MSDWVDVSPVSEFGDGKSRLIEVNESRIAVFNLQGDFFAMFALRKKSFSELDGDGIDIAGKQFTVFGQGFRH